MLTSPFSSKLSLPSTVSNSLTANSATTGSKLVAPAASTACFHAATSFKARTYKKVDGADDFSCRPDFAMPIYPAYLLDKQEQECLAPYVTIDKQCPPFFFVHTGDDHIPVEGSVLSYLALEKAGVVGNELHIYPFGGHGYGLRSSKHAVSQWPQRARSWLTSLDLIKE